MKRRRRTQQQRGGVNRSARNNKCISANSQILAIAFDFGFNHLFAGGVCDEPSDDSASHQFNVARGEGGPHTRQVGIGLSIHLTGKSVASFAPNAPSALSQINSSGKEEGVQSLMFEPPFEILDVRLMRDCWKWEGL